MNQVIRGGGMSSPAQFVRVADRFSVAPSIHPKYTGLRIAKHKDQAKTTRGGSWISISSGHIFSSCYYSSGYLSTSHDARGFRITRRKP